MILFNESETEAKPSAPEPEILVKPHKRKKKVGHREELLAKLPHQKIVVEPVQQCPATYRQESEWKCIGLAFSRANLANLIIIASKEWLALVYGRMHEMLLEECCLHADEIPVQVHNEKGRKNTSKSYMWVYANTALNPTRKIRLIEYAPTRNAHCAEPFLEGFSVYLLTDDYVDYHPIKTAGHCLCWAHARWKFVDASPVYVKETDGLENTLVKAGIDQISQLFDKEKEYKSLSPGERHERCLGEEKSILKALFAWAENNVDKLLPKSLLATAMNHLLSNRDGLTGHLKDGHCDISNNTAENSTRPFTVERKNWLFSNRPKGAKASAIVYSLIETAKANDLDPERYLKYLFEKLPNAANFKDAETLDQYLPWATKTQEKCKE